MSFCGPGNTQRFFTVENKMKGLFAKVWFGSRKPARGSEASKD